MRVCKTVDLGLIPYSEALSVQRDLAGARKRGAAPDVLLICEHPHVLTLGRNGKKEHLKASAAGLEQLGIELHQINRGGDITYHGPGQVVGYPILNLGEIRRDVVWYMRQLEEVLIRASADLGAHAFRVPGCAGVWVGASCDAEIGGDGSHAPAAPGAAKEKLAAIGVHISRWVTSHGFAYNVSADLNYFDLIVPCGIAGCRVTTLERVLSRPVVRASIVGRIVQQFGSALSTEMQPADREELNAWLAAVADSSKEATAAGVRAGL